MSLIFHFRREKCLHTQTRYKVDYLIELFNIETTTKVRFATCGLASKFRLINDIQYLVFHPMDARARILATFYLRFGH